MLFVVIIAKRSSSVRGLSILSGTKGGSSIHSSLAGSQSVFCYQSKSISHFWLFSIWYDPLVPGGAMHGLALQRVSTVLGVVGVSWTNWNAAPLVCLHAAQLGNCVPRTAHWLDRLLPGEKLSGMRSEDQDRILHLTFIPTIEYLINMIAYNSF